jgi:hypothetical protein
VMPVVGGSVHTKIAKAATTVWQRIDKSDYPENLSAFLNPAKVHFVILGDAEPDVYPTNLRRSELGPECFTANVIPRRSEKSTSRK